MVPFRLAFVLLAVAPIPGLPQAFEAASVKPTAAADLRGSTYQFTAGGGVKITNGTLKGMIEMAYDVRDFEILGAPGWADSTRYSVLARSEREPGASVADTRRKLQALLAERFQLKVHRETKEVPVYALEPAKNGSKLTEATEAGDSANSKTGIRTACGQMIGTRATLANLVVMLARQLDRPVLDETGLTGRYDFQMEWTPDVGPCSPPSDGGDAGAAARAPDGPTLFGALAAQLGLKLEAKKAPVELLAIDHAEKADAN